MDLATWGPAVTFKQTLPTYRKLQGHAVTERPAWQAAGHARGPISPPVDALAHRSTVIRPALAPEGGLAEGAVLYCSPTPGHDTKPAPGTATGRNP